MKKALCVVAACVLLISGMVSTGATSSDRVTSGPAYMPGVPVVVPESPPPMDKHSPWGHFIMYAPWRTQSVNCDGVVDVATEWSDAAYYDISDTSGQQDGIPDPVGTVDLYVKQDSFGVWFAVINHADNSLDEWDQIGLYLDDDHDGCFSNILTNEGNIWVQWDTTTTTAVATWRCIQDTNCQVPIYNCMGDIFCDPLNITLPCYAIGLTNNQVSYEVMVPYGVLDQEIDVPSPVGMNIGLFIFAYDYHTGNIHGEWPSQGRSTTWQEPCFYGDLYCEGGGEWYFKPGYLDYAPNGMPDFDQKKTGWDYPPGSGGGYFYCGPVAVGNCLWWFDSKFEPGNNPPPAVSDGYPLVTSWGTWDDHDTSNVRLFIDDLAMRMRTNPLWGTYVDTMQMAIDQLLIETGLADSLEETTYYQPDFYFIEDEIKRSQDVILLLGFWYEYGPGEWVREGGHYVTCAGVNSEALVIALSDPYYDNAEAGGSGQVHDGSLIPHIHGGHGPNIHDDAGNVSHDYYHVNLNSPSPGGSWWLPDYPPGSTKDFFARNVPQRFAKYQAPRLHGEKQEIHTEVEAAVVICPKEPEWYFKPDYPDYAPSGMPDFDQKQDLWDNPPGSQNWTYCGPVAVSNCLWWFDSKYQWLIDPLSPPPPTVNDDFNFVTAYGTWDDHDTANVMPLVRDLAWHMDTDGLRTGDAAQGTNVFEMEAAIAEWFLETGTDTIFYKHTKKAPDFYWIEEEIERCEDVILLLGFWQYYGPEEWLRVGGHYVTCAGVNSDSLEIAFSDPFYDMAEMGFPGRVRDGILIPHAAGHSSYDHNDAGNVSHDFYRVIYDQFSPGGPWSIPDYPRDEGILFSLQSANCPPEFGEQQGTYNQGLPVHTEIEYAVAISPIPEYWHYKGEYPDYAPDGMPDFDQNQHMWTAYCGPTAVANCLWWFDSKYQWLRDPGNPPPPYDHDTFDLVTTYIPGYDDHSYELDPPGFMDNVQFLIDDLAVYLGTDPATGTKIDDMQEGIKQWLMDRGLDDVFYEHTLIDSLRDPEFFFIIEDEIERCQDVILLLGFWQEWAPGVWKRVGGHYVTCAGVCSDSLLIMFSDPDFDQQPTDYPYYDPKWHNNAALVSHDVYQLAPNSPSPGGFWWIPGYPEEVGFRHALENCPDHLQQYQDYPEQGIPIHTEIEGAVFVSPIMAPPEAVQNLEIYTAFRTTAAASTDIRLIWSPVTQDILGNFMPPDYYVIYRDTQPYFTPGPAKILATTTDTTYVDPNAAGSVAVNYYYIVNAVKGLSWESANSQEVGEFDRTLSN